MDIYSSEWDIVERLKCQTAVPGVNLADGGGGGGALCVPESGRDRHSESFSF